MVVLTISKLSRGELGDCENILQNLDSRGLNYVGIEILRVDNMFGDGEDEECFLLGDEDFNTQVTMGRSIGPKGSSKHPSTFGGFVKIQHQNGEWFRLGLTCFRCVAPADSDDPALKHWQQNGIAPYE